MNKTPSSIKPHIAVFGKRNAGKSSLINALVGRSVSIVSEKPGTTTDPVSQPYELIPYGPVIFIDTAGIDDSGDLGRKRIERTADVLKKTDLALLTLTGEPDDWEKNLLASINKLGIPFVVVVNKIDLGMKIPAPFPGTAGEEVMRVSAVTGENIGALRSRIIERLPARGQIAPEPLSGLVKPGDLVMLIIPIDLEAPAGRIILPQVQVIRDVLDKDCMTIICKETDIAGTIGCLKRLPDLAICDSQAVDVCFRSLPAEVKLTTFSMIFGRVKGDLAEYVRAVSVVGSLAPGDRVLVLELCSHNVMKDDIGREKLPRWFKKRLGFDLDFDYVCGADALPDISGYRLVIQCGGCMVNRRLIQSRINEIKNSGVMVTNYGVIISYLNGVLEKTLEPFGLEMPVQAAPVSYETGSRSDAAGKAVPKKPKNKPKAR